MPRRTRIRLTTADPHERLSTVLPLPVVEHIRAAADKRLTTVSAWLRDCVLARLEAEGRLVVDEDLDCEVA